MAIAPSCATQAMQGVFWRNSRLPGMLPDAWHGVHVYAGSALDLGIIGWVAGVWEFPPERRDAQHGAWAMLLLDLPFSLVADTLLLPMTLCQQVGIIPQPEPRKR